MLRAGGSVFWGYILFCNSIFISSVGAYIELNSVRSLLDVTFIHSSLRYEFIQSFFSARFDMKDTTYTISVCVKSQTGGKAKKKKLAKHLIRHKTQLTTWKEDFFECDVIV